MNIHITRLLCGLFFCLLIFSHPAAADDWDPEEAANQEKWNFLQPPNWGIRGFHAPKDLPFPYVRHIIEGQNGSVWLSTWGGGLAHFDGIQTRFITMQDGLYSNKTRRMAMDRFGGIWVCNWEGINYIAPDGEIFGYQKEDFPGSLNANCLSVAIDTEGTVWIGAYNFQLFTIRLNPNATGFPYEEKGDVYPLGYSEYDRDGDIEDLVFDREGNLWLGVNGYGVVMLAPDGSRQSWTDLFEKEYIVNNQIFDIELHPQDGIYVGVNDLNYHITKDGVKKSHRVPFGSCMAILALDDFILYGSTKVLPLQYPEGSVMYHEYPYKRIDLDQEQSEQYIRCITKMSDGTVWVGTQNGAYRFSPSVWQNSADGGGAMKQDVPLYLAQNPQGSLLQIRLYNEQQEPDIQSPSIVFDPRIINVYGLYADRWRYLGELLKPNRLDIPRSPDFPVNDQVFYEIIHSIYTPDGSQYDTSTTGVYEIRTTDPISVKKLPHLPIISGYPYGTINHKNTILKKMNFGSSMNTAHTAGMERIG